MKTKKVHLVPMSTQVLATLKNLSQIDTGSDYVFPTPRNRNASITTNALLVAIRSLELINLHLQHMVSDPWLAQD